MNKNINKQLALIAVFASLQANGVSAMTEKTTEVSTAATTVAVNQSSTASANAPVAVVMPTTTPTPAPVTVVTKDPVPTPQPAPTISKGALRVAREIQSGQHGDWVPRAPSSQDEQGHWERVNSGVDNVGLVFEQVAAGNENSLWAVAKGALYQHTPKHGWKQRGRGVYVAVGGDGTVVSLDATGNLFEYQGNNVKDADEAWELVPNIKLSSVAVFDKTTMWGVHATDEGNEVFQCKDGNWAPARNMLGEEALGVKFMSVNAQGILMGIRDDGSLVMFDMATKLPVVKPVARKKGGKKNKRVKTTEVKAAPKAGSKNIARGARAISARHTHKPKV